MYDVALSRIKTFINCLVALGVVGLGELGHSSEAVRQTEYHDLQRVGLVGDVWDDRFHNVCCFAYPLGRSREQCTTNIRKVLCSLLSNSEIVHLVHIRKRRKRV